MVDLDHLLMYAYTVADYESFGLKEKLNVEVSGGCIYTTDMFSI